MSQFVLTFTCLSSWLILLPLAFHILLHATFSAMDYTPNVVSKRCFSLYLSIYGLEKILENFTRVLERPGKVLDFFPGKEWEPWLGDLLCLFVFAVFVCYCVCVCMHMCYLCFLCVFWVFPLQFSPSVLWYCWLGLLTCKNHLPYNLYCVGGDVKHCTILCSPTNISISSTLKWGCLFVIPLTTATTERDIWTRY